MLKHPTWANWWCIKVQRLLVTAVSSTPAAPPCQHRSHTDGWQSDVTQADDFQHSSESKRFSVPSCVLETQRMIQVLNNVREENVFELVAGSTSFQQCRITAHHRGQCWYNTCTSPMSSTCCVHLHEASSRFLIVQTVKWAPVPQGL